MEITAEQIMQLHKAYNDATGFNAPFNVVWERNLYEAAKMGLTAEMFSLVLKERWKGVRCGERRAACLMPRNLVIGDDAINEVLVEASALLAMRRKVVDIAKQSVVNAWNGAPKEEATPPARASKEVLAKLAEELKRAVA